MVSSEIVRSVHATVLDVSFPGNFASNQDLGQLSFLASIRHLWHRLRFRHNNARFVVFI